ncbi:MAG TPA: FMN-binding negative transcriptional regulator [Povalibacter sp.]|nr:FMN-binding negative transcriptional regulator [Povalibacter sp.]
MYIPAQFLEERPEVLSAFIRKHPLGTLIALSPEGLTANHVPMLWSEAAGARGVLRGHVARANPVWQALTCDSPVLVVFHGASRYISPSWYPAKQEHGKVVPTWNYSVVHAQGTIRFLDDPHRALEAVTTLTSAMESSREAPWQVSDAPAPYIDALVRQIVAFEISVTRIVGKFKASQHRPDSERERVAAALNDSGVVPADLDEVVRSPRPSTAG